MGLEALATNEEDTADIAITRGNPSEPCYSDRA
jgi:hypothetical protein